MAESKKTELEIHREMMTLLSHLREKKTRVRKKVPMAQTSKQEIKADVRKILEQFLKKQQLNDDEEEGAIPTGFQREDVGNVTETYRSGSTNTSWEEYECLRCEAGCRSKVIKSIPTCSNRSPTDDTTNFTFIDEYEHDVERSDKDHSERSNSPPFSDKIPVYGAGPPRRLQSGTESETDNTDYDEVISPNEDAEKIAEGRAGPATGLQGIRVCEAGAPQRLQSGTESETDDTDYDEVISPNEDAEKIAEGRARPAMWLQGIRVCEAGAPERLQSGTESETAEGSRSRARPAMGLQEIPVYGAGRPRRLQSGTESETDDTDYDEVISPNEDAKIKTEGTTRPAMWPQGILVCEAGAPQRLQSGTESETDDTDFNEVISSNEDAEKIAEGRARPAIGLQEIPVYGAGPPQRLQSGTESETGDTDYNEVISPNEDAEKIAEGRARPAIGRQRLVSGTESDTDDTDFGKEFISLKEDIEWIRVGSARGLQRLMSETEPKTDDTDYEEEVISRKKDIERREVGAAKPAIGRQRLMSGTESDTDDNDYRSVIIKRWKSRKDIDSSVNKRGDVVQNVHTHKISHVEQHNYTNGNKSGMLMESEVWECKDLAGKSEHKHGERHSNIRETMRPRHATSGRTSSEKDRLYTAVAEKLAHIGDHYKATSPLSDSTRSSVDNTATRRASARTPNLPGVDERGSDGLTALERQLIDTLREVGDSFQLKLSPNAVKEIVKQAMYQRFQEVVDKKTGPGNSWDHIAAVFYLTKKVVTMAGVGRAVALQVKDLAAEYVADKFATWIVDQGGWDTFLDSDSDLD